MVLTLNSKISLIKKRQTLLRKYNLIANKKVLCCSNDTKSNQITNVLTSQQAKAQRIYAHAVLNYKTQREPVLAAARGPLACPSYGARHP